MFTRQYKIYYTTVNSSFFTEFFSFYTNKVFNFKTNKIFSKSSSQLDTAVLFWYSIETFSTFFFLKDIFYKSRQKSFSLTAIDNNSFFFLPINENLSILKVFYKEFNILFLEKLTFNFLNAWNRIPDYEKKYMELIKNKKNTFLINVPKSEVNENTLLQIQNKFLSSFNIKFQFGFNIEYGQYAYFFFSFFRII